ncbi:hypothetical protein [Microbacterium sp. ZW T5_56]|uniref:hypothetical protein n=1 Tax=Microbacterium sp. ZW T5_56 TaxID=3378081 RepID=UPI003853581A
MTPRRDAAFTRRAFLAGAGVVALAALTACTPDTPASPQARPLTAAEAELLASFRLKNYLAEHVNYTLTGPESLPIQATVRLDTQAHTGYGLVTMADTPTSIVVWGEKSVFTCTDAARGEDLSTWAGRDLGEGDIDTFLRMMLLLSSDRPENAQLLQQSQYLWVGTETVGGVTCDVFTGPGEAGGTGSPDAAASPVRYYLDADGQLQYFSARVSADDASPWTATRTDTAPDVQIPAAVWDAMAQAAAA